MNPKELEIIQWGVQNGKSKEETREAIVRFRLTGSPQDPNAVQPTGANQFLAEGKAETSPKIANLIAQTERAEREFEEATSGLGMTVETVKQFGEKTGVTPALRKVAAGIAPAIVEKEELPFVVDELAGGVSEPRKMGDVGTMLKDAGFSENTAEWADLAVDLPFFSLGISKTITKGLTKGGVTVVPKLMTLLDRPLLDFLPEAFQNVLKKDISTPVKETIEGGVEKVKGGVETGVTKIKEGVGDGFERKVARTPEELEKEIETTVGRIIQGKPADVSKAVKALSEVDTQGVTTYKELNTRIRATSKAIKKNLDEILEQQEGLFKSKDVVQTTKVGDTTVKQNFIDKSIAQLKELYTKIDDAEGLAKITNIEKKFKKDGLTIKEMNDIAVEYGREFGSKAFSKTGEPLTSVNAQAFENTRKGVKETLRSKMDSDVAKVMDSKMHVLIQTEGLTKKMEVKVNTLFQKVKQRGLFEKIANKVGSTLDLVSLKTLSGFLSRMLPSNVGLKTMNSLDIEEELSKNLIKLEKLLANKSDDEVVDGLIDIIKKGEKSLLNDKQIPIEAPTTPKKQFPLGLSIEDVSGGKPSNLKAKGEIPSTSLLDEAKKFKSADEFIRSREVKGNDADFRNSLLRGEDIIEVGGRSERRLDTSPNKKFIFEENNIPSNATEVTIYRSAPGEIRPGDFAGLNKGTAELHLRNPDDKIFTKKVPVSDLLQGADQFEVIYVPESQVFSKSQLKDIWNQSQKVTPTSLIDEAKKFDNAETFTRELIKKPNQRYEGIATNNRLEKEFATSGSDTERGKIIWQQAKTSDEPTAKWVKRIENGERPPIVITESVTGKEAIFDGHNRLKAYRELGFDEIPTIRKEQLEEIWNQANKK